MPRKRTSKPKPAPSNSEQPDSRAGGEQAGGQRSNKITRKTTTRRAQDEVALASAETVAEIEKSASVQPVIITNSSKKPNSPAETIDQNQSEFQPKGVSRVRGTNPRAPVRDEAHFGTEVSLQEQIALLAYSYWEARGRQGGSPDDDWFRAEREIKSRYPFAAK